MGLIWILFNQLVVMLLLMAVGYWLFKTRKITERGNKELGTLLLYAVLPCAIVNSYISVDFTPEKIKGLLWSFAAAALSLVLAILVSRFVFGNKHKIEHFGTAFSNAGFMGIPIVQAVIGTEAVFYVAAFVALLNILQWTYGVVVMSERRDAISAKRLMTNPIILAMLLGVALYVLQFPVPAVLRTTIANLAGMNAPVAMIVLGAYVAQMPLRAMFSERYAYMSTLFRLIVIPLLSIVALCLIPLQYRDIRLAILIAACAPVGSNVAIFAEMNGLDYTRAVKSVCLSTICSILTMPAIVAIAQVVW